MEPARRSGSRSAYHVRIFCPYLALTPISAVGETPSRCISLSKPLARRGLHPFIQGLVKTLPTPDSDWSVADRVKWLQTAANVFGLIYKGAGSIKSRLRIRSHHALFSMQAIRYGPVCSDISRKEVTMKTFILAALLSLFAVGTASAMQPCCEPVQPCCDGGPCCD